MLLFSMAHKYFCVHSHMLFSASKLNGDTGRDDRKCYFCHLSDRAITGINYIYEYLAYFLHRASGQ